MTGRPDFSQAGSNGSGQTVAVTQRPELTSINADTTTTVGSGATEITEVYAPTGSIYSVQALYMACTSDSNATTGDHTIHARPMDFGTVLYGQANYNTTLEFGQGQWKSADVSKLPSDPAASATIVGQMRATEGSALVFKYENNTDAAQDNKRAYDLIVEETSY